MEANTPFTKRCQRCALPLYREHTHLCDLCEDHPPMFDHAMAAVDYALPWSNALAQLKFQQDTALAKALSKLMLPAILQRWQLPAHPTHPSLRRLKAGAPSLIIPVPLSAQRLQERGYNQAALLASHLGQQLHLPVHHHALSKKRHISRMMAMGSEDRRQQIKGVFAVEVHAQTVLKNRHVAVVDDVLTTGATLNEIARLLWQAGAREVSVWVAARTPEGR